MREGWRDLNRRSQRARRYLDAGADVIFPEALETEGEFEEFARRIKAPLLANMTEFGKSPLMDLKRLGGMGYRLVIFPQTAFRVAMKAEEMALRELRKYGTQKRFLKKMQTRGELYRMLGYNPEEAAQKAAAKRGSEIAGFERNIFMSEADKPAYSPGLDRRDRG